MGECSLSRVSGGSPGQPRAWVRSEGGVGGERWEGCLISEVWPAKGEWGEQLVQVPVEQEWIE
jgi:hypothetical protein